MIDNQLTRNVDDDHGTGEGFEMGRKSSDGRYNSDLEENFDPLQESFFSLEKKNDQNDNSTIKVTNDTAEHIKKANHVYHDDIYIENDPEKPYQEEDEEEDYFHEKGNTTYHIVQPYLDTYIKLGLNVYQLFDFQQNLLKLV